MTRWPDAFREVPLAELHLHAEGSISPQTACELAARHGLILGPAEVAARYAYTNFLGFLDAFKWVTSLLQSPADYALIIRRLCEALRSQNVRYAEVTISAGVMLWRHQDVEANFAAIREAATTEDTFPRIQWILDAVRQFGPAAALDVARLAVALKAAGVVAFGMGGDELSLPVAGFREVYDYAAANGLHRLVHAGEVGGPEQIREAIECLGAERIGHGIAAFQDAGLTELLRERRIALEVCPTSNLLTGALARQLNRPGASLKDHPLPLLLRSGVPVTLATDDPAMFRVTLQEEYRHAQGMGLSTSALLQIARAGFEYAFLPESDKKALLETFEREINRLGLL
jgi:aminodeoxyfutalosine deaminase